jgi:hypothetical protein
MVNDHVGPKTNQLKVLEIAFGTITCLKIGYMAWKKRIGQTVAKILQVRCHNNPHFADSAFGKLFIGWRKLSPDAGIVR